MKRARKIVPLVESSTYQGFQLSSIHFVYIGEKVACMIIWLLVVKADKVFISDYIGP